MMDFILNMMDFIPKMMDFTLKMMDFILNMMDFILKKMASISGGARSTGEGRAKRAACGYWVGDQVRV